MLCSLTASIIEPLLLRPLMMFPVGRRVFQVQIKRRSAVVKFGMAITNEIA